MLLDTLVSQFDPQRAHTKRRNWAKKENPVTWVRNFFSFGKGIFSRLACLMNYLILCESNDRLVV